MRKQITFWVSYLNKFSIYRPVVGEIVYLKESNTLHKSNGFDGTKSGDVSKSVFTLSNKPFVSIPDNIEIEEGWLGAFCTDRTQKDYWSLGRWRVTKVIDLPLPKEKPYECESKFRVYLTKVK